MYRRSINLALISLAFATVLGCGDSGPKLYSLKGVVTHNGKPVANLYLTFLPTDPAAQAPASSSTDASGRFELKVGAKGGVYPGKYIVTCSDPAAMMGGKSSDDPDYAVVVKKYAQGKSTYTMEVDKNNSNLELKLD